MGLTIFKGKSFSVTFTADLVIILVLFVVGLVAFAVLIYGPSNEPSLYSKKNRNVYYSGAGSMSNLHIPGANHETAKSYTTENPFQPGANESIPMEPISLAVEPSASRNSDAAGDTSYHGPQASLVGDNLSGDLSERRY